MSVATLPIIARRSLHEELVEALQAMIVEGVLKPGAKVPEKELCVRFGVSRTPMREALKVLAADGLVTLETNRGAWVTELTARELADLFEVMASLEALAGELACKRITPDQLSAIRSHHAAMMDHYEQRDRQAYFRANQLIHELIVAAAHNETLAATHRSIGIRIKRARYAANLTDERWTDAMKEHGDILDALERGASEDLARQLRKHLHNKLASIHTPPVQETS